MFTPAPAVNLAISVGKEAVLILNKWLDSEEIAEAWYSKEPETKNFFTKSFLPRFFRNKINGKPTIKKVFVLQKEDWEVVIKESLAVSYTWYSKRKNFKGECSWLPLYWAACQSLDKEQISQPVTTACSSLGIVAGLPAARLDLWGLVVMAYANGARDQIVEDNNGGFRVSLFAKNFVLDINQKSVNAQTVGHLEPREHPSQDCELMGVDETKNLLDHGHSFGINDTLIGWPLNREADSSAPQDLVDGH